MNSKDNFQGIWDNSPFVAWINNISKNQMKYLNSHIKDMNLGHEMRYIMAIFDNPGISQDDLVNMFGQSKATVAKSLKKLEDDGYIKREVNPENRRKYMLNTTSKADELVPKIRKISKDWEKEVGITDEDYELKKRIKEIAINGMKLTEGL
ncbi:MarR family winged helix-turn-helix transcriptional regulator [uncultured Methanobrevibacter sp.]|uniref:MarR family winged helix-turn-helix transcriptional regulator n=1 Tax=uncultured Methanobrevibacter sp. TaxID=253161 RepID=UPI0025E91326|nr:MarR family transcriptional regulator [uncultured Methanobrevibacter sp.]